MNSATLGNGGTRTYLTGSDHRENAINKRNAILEAAFHGLAQTVHDSIDDYIKEKGDLAIERKLTQDLFDENSFSIDLKSIIKQLENEFFELLKANLQEYFDQTPETETQDQVNQIKTQLINHTEGIRKTILEVVRLLEENEWIVEYTLDEKSGFFKTLSISTKSPTPEDVQLTMWQRFKKVFD